MAEQSKLNDWFTSDPHHREHGPKSPFSSSSPARKNDGKQHLFSEPRNFNFISSPPSSLFASQQLNFDLASSSTSITFLRHTYNKTLSQHITRLSTIKLDISPTFTTQHSYSQCSLEESALSPGEPLSLLLSPALPSSLLPDRSPPLLPSTLRALTTRRSSTTTRDPEMLAP
jgi:hypothetical protein